MYNSCLVCGEPLKDNNQLCNWCANPKFEELLRGLIYEFDDILQEVKRIDVKMDPLLSFIADVGLLALQHKLLTSFAKALATLIVESRRISKLKLRKVQYGQKNIEPFIFLLQEYDLVEYDQDKKEIIIPTDSILRKVGYEVEIEPRRNPAAAFIFGYVVLKALLTTLELVRSGKRITYDEGITLLYSLVKRRNEIKLMVPKGFTATLSFILGFWSRDLHEFGELDLRKFMNSRGITDKEFETILATYTCAFASSHALFEKTSVQDYGRIKVYTFRLNSEYTKLYNRIRERRVTNL